MPRRDVQLTNPQKVYFPSGYTKGDMLRYYVEIAPFMLPHLKDRPVTLIRFPNGVKGEKFYEKNAPGHAPEWIRTHAVPRQHHEGDIKYILVQDVETLTWCANLGAIEFHPFLHRAPRLERPTQVVFDLDPGEGADLLDCIEVAQLLREIFRRLDLEACPKVSGSKGLQIYVPLNTAVTYAVTTPFAKTVAELLAKEHPKLIVSEMSKDLRKGRVMIDWSQNSASKTTVGVYSMRGKRDEPFISAPVTWGELENSAKKQDKDVLFFSPETAVNRAKKMGDIFAPVLTTKQRLPADFARAAQKTAVTALNAYAAKRDFTKTAEPGAVVPRRSRQGSVRRFVIQKHAASHLHFDFRLEMDGTLKSWAVPKGLPYEKGVRRSAFQVEDHPIEYLEFEGTIPKGQYGGGTVMVWDIGTYEVISGNWDKGDLKLWLEGKKLKGEWHIFRIKSDESKPVWLVIKGGDPMKPLSAKQEDSSVLTKRSMAKIASDNEVEWQSNRPAGKHQESTAAATPQPGEEVTTAREPTRASRRKALEPVKFIEPMKALGVETVRAGDWHCEIKFDGYRALALVEKKKAVLWSRNEKPLDYPDIAAELGRLSCNSAILDGEIVAMDAKGRSRFQLLQQRQMGEATPIFFYVFDLLHLDGRSLIDEPFEERQALLTKLLRADGRSIKQSPVFDVDPANLLEQTQGLGLEGIIMKARGSRYEPGQRSGAWLKVKNLNEQEFVIGGFTPPKNSRPNFGSIAVGYYDRGKLLYAGKVGTGFDRKLLANLHKQFFALRVDECPFGNLPMTHKSRFGQGMSRRAMREVTWIRPELVAQVKFAEWTEEGLLRQPVFLGLRTDKAARKVRREAAHSE